MKLTEVACRTDSKGECTEIKFSPSNDLVRTSFHWIIR